MEGKIKLQLSNANYCFAEESTKFVENAHGIYLKYDIILKFHAIPTYMNSNTRS